MLGDIVYKLLMGLSPEDVRLAINSGCGREMRNLVEALGWLAFRWWSSDEEKDSKKLKDIQSRLGELQLILYKSG